MPLITYRSSNGIDDVVEVGLTTTLMRGAKQNSVDGIEAQCGGAAQCGTCHVYIETEHHPLLPPMDEVEDDVLEGTACPRRATSRLSCQLPVTEEMEGLVVHLPEAQI